MRIDSTIVFEKNQAATSRIVVDEGGARSSKTVSLCQLFITETFRIKGQGKVFSVVRKTMPALRFTAMKDFFEELKKLDLYRESNHNKTDNIYHLNGNEIEFFSVDDSQKIRGRKRYWLWANEANELRYEEWRQLILRTTGRAFMDYNPSDEYHWIYDKVLTRPDVTVIHSTYKDNPFLEPEVIKEIELLKDEDENAWNVYGLGLRGTSVATIYTHWSLVDALPEEVDEEIYGLDFGFNNPTALVQIGIKDQETYWKEKLYAKYMTNTELINHMLGWDRMSEDRRNAWLNQGKSESDIINLNIPFDKIIYADSAEPQRIQELREAGFWVEPADKSVKDGIQTVKSKKMHITKDSPNVQKEVKSYKWKEKDGVIIDEPVKVNDHSMDAGRYAVHTHKKRPFIGFV